MSARRSIVPGGLSCYERSNEGHSRCKLTFRIIQWQARICPAPDPTKTSNSALYQRTASEAVTHTQPMCPWINFIPKFGRLSHRDIQPGSYFKLQNWCVVAAQWRKNWVVSRIHSTYLYTNAPTSYKPHRSWPWMECQQNRSKHRSHTRTSPSEALRDRTCWSSHLHGGAHHTQICKHCQCKGCCKELVNSSIDTDEAGSQSQSTPKMVLDKQMWSRRKGSGMNW